MANRRMIAKSISVSDETNALSDFAALLFTWLIPHTDDYGVIPGSPGRIKALVVPRRKQNETEIDAALEEMRSVGLIYRYRHAGQPYIQLVRFDAHQEGLHKRTAPRSPVYQQAVVEQSGGKFPEVPADSAPIEPNLTEPRQNEANPTATEPPGPVASQRAVVVDMLSKNICAVTTPIELSLVDEWLCATSAEWIAAAIRQAVLNKAGSIKYVDTILRAWLAKYRPEDKPWQLEQPRRPRRGTAVAGASNNFIDTLADLAQAASP